MKYKKLTKTYQHILNFKKSLSLNLTPLFSYFSLNPFLGVVKVPLKELKSFAIFTLQGHPGGFEAKDNQIELLFPLKGVGGLRDGNRYRVHVGISEL